MQIAAPRALIFIENFSLEECEYVEGRWGVNIYILATSRLGDKTR